MTQKAPSAVSGSDSINYLSVQSEKINHQYKLMVELLFMSHLIIYKYFLRFLFSSSALQHVCLNESALAVSGSCAAKPHHITAKTFRYSGNLTQSHNDTVSVATSKERVQPPNPSNPPPPLQPLMQHQ